MGCVQQMTSTQFEALATLTGLRHGPTQVGAALVLVDGVRVTDAAVQAGISQPSLSNTLARCRATLDLVQVLAPLAAVDGA